MKLHRRYLIRGVYQMAGGVALMYLTVQGMLHFGNPNNIWEIILGSVMVTAFFAGFLLLLVGLMFALKSIFN